MSETKRETKDDWGPWRLAKLVASVALLTIAIAKSFGDFDSMVIVAIAGLSGMLWMDGYRK